MKIKAELSSLREGLKKLEYQEEGILEAEAEKRKEIHQVKLKISEVQFGVKIGTIVKHNDILHRVTKIDPRWVSAHPNSLDDKPWLYGNPMKKDGTYGTAVRSMFSSWELA